MQQAFKLFQHKYTLDIITISILLSSLLKNINIEFNIKIYFYIRPCPKNALRNCKNDLNHIHIIFERGNSNLLEILDDADDFEKYNMVRSDTLNLICNTRY